MIKIDLNNFEEVISYLEKCDDAYFNSDEVLLTDSEYDNIKHMAKKMNPNHPYFVKVGSDVRGGKVDLPYQMPGLEQFYDNNEIKNKWGDKQKETFIVTDKLDGTSALVIFANKNSSDECHFVSAYSRGNTLQGADITRIVKYMHFPKIIKDYSLLVIRAESVMENEIFDKKYSKDNSNARSMVAGRMNRKEAEPDVIADISLVAYSIIEIRDLHGNKLHLSKSKSLQLLQTLGFKTPNYKKVTYEDLNECTLKSLINIHKTNSPFELDGIVVTDDMSHDSFKFKSVDSSSIVTTKCRAVHYEISKSGYQKPTVEINPVKLFGTIVTYATGFNAKYIVDNCIGPGAEIVITKSGNVIPYIIEVVSPATSGKPQLPDGDNIWNETGVELVVKDAENHPEVKFKQVLDFFETLQVDLLGRSSLSELFNAYNLSNKSYESCITTIIDLTEYEWINVIGANGKKIYESLHRRLQNLKLEVFLGSLKYFGFGFGVRKAKSILAQISAEDFWNLTPNHLTNLYGFDVKTAERVCAGIPLAKKLFDSLEGFITFVKDSKTDELKGVTVVFTGFRDSDLEMKIESMGGKVSTSISKKVNYLITAEDDSSSSKAKKAKDLGVEILSLTNFKDRFNI